MIIFISDSLFLLYIITFLVIIITIYKCIKAKKIETKTIVITLIGVVYLLFYLTIINLRDYSLKIKFLIIKLIELMVQ